MQRDKSALRGIRDTRLVLRNARRMPLLRMRDIADQKIPPILIPGRRTARIIAAVSFVRGVF
jgi:hypothetical protein